jgi:hypothetical protein
VYSITPDVAADTGIHLGDGSLFIGRKESAGTYRYEVIGHATEDQLYLIGQVMPTVSAAYGLRDPGIYVNREMTWASIRYHSKNVVLFKHETLGLPNGKKSNASIPAMIRTDSHLMRHLAREILATDGVLGFYNASPKHAHKYARIQIKLTATLVIEELARFLRDELGMSVSCRMNCVSSDGWHTRPQHIIQLNCSDEINLWRREIGFSNPSHISRMMVFEALGECPPRTSIVDRLSFLSGCSSTLGASRPITESAFDYTISKMKREFGSPMLDAHTIIERIRDINVRLRHLGRELPRIVETRASEAKW